MATIHRSVLTGFKGYFGFLAAIGTNRGKHFALGLIAIAILTVSISL
jgi:hypothetical protein